MRGLGGRTIVVVAGGLRSDRPSLGAATAIRLAAEGANVVVSDLSMDAAGATARQAATEGLAGEVVPAECDVADEASVQALFGLAAARFGGVDGVHSNAMDMSPGTLGVDSHHDLLTLPLGVWQRSLDVGLTGFLVVARTAIPYLLERGGGGIVGTASGAVFAGEPVRLGYAAAKTGMTAIMRHIASAYGQQGIRANCVAPGLVPGESGMANMNVPVERLLKTVRSTRLGRPEDIAGMVAFLLSDDGEWINGQLISVDGGSVLGH